MLFSQGSDLTRLQCGFVDTPEIEKMVAFVGNQIGYTTLIFYQKFSIKKQV